MTSEFNFIAENSGLTAASMKQTDITLMMEAVGNIYQTTMRDIPADSHVYCHSFLINNSVRLFYILCLNSLAYSFLCLVNKQETSAFVDVKSL
jgi:hypothetical protein